MLIQIETKESMKLRTLLTFVLLINTATAAEGLNLPEWFKPYVNIIRIGADHSSRKQVKKCLHVVDARTLNLSGLQGNITFTLDELPAPTQSDNKPPTNPEDERLLRTCGVPSDQRVNEFDYSIKPSGKFKKLIDVNLYLDGNMRSYYANDWEIKRKKISFTLDEVSDNQKSPKRLSFEYYSENILVDKKEHLVAILLECEAQGTDDDYDEDGNPSNVIGNN